MHDFKYIKGELCCEDVKLSEVAAKCGTPAYVYSKKTILDHYKKLEAAFKDIKPLICFSMKANSNLALCKTLLRAGAGLDIVSGGELFKAEFIAAPAKKLVYASVGKKPEEIEDAIGYGILAFNVESIPELREIDRIAKKFGGAKRSGASPQGTKPRVCLRINPDVTPQTHRFIATGKKETKFGLDIKTAKKIFLNRGSYRNLDICGIHLHIGSQITEKRPYISALKKTAALIAEIKRKGVRLEYLNIGGGLGIIYHDEKPQAADEFARALLPILKKIGLKVILEPGRFIVGNAGVLLAKVLYIKKTPHKNFIIIDAAMNDLIRPSLYGAYHEVLPIQGSRTTIKADIVGPVCESGDFLAKDRVLPLLKSGDMLALMSAGAYGFVMSSNYNSRPRAAEVLVDGRSFKVVRRRESYKDLIRGEAI